MALIIRWLLTDLQVLAHCGGPRQKSSGVCPRQENGRHWHAGHERTQQPGTAQKKLFHFTSGIISESKPLNLADFRTLTWTYLCTLPVININRKMWLLIWAHASSTQSAFQVSVAADQHLIAQDLLLLGAEINTMDCWGRSPLHVCAEKGHTSTLQVTFPVYSLSLNGNPPFFLLLVLYVMCCCQLITLKGPFHCHFIYWGVFTLTGTSTTRLSYL